MPDPMTFIRTLSPLDTMLAGIARAVRENEAERPRRVGDAIAAFAARDDLLAGRDCPCCPEHYVRHLLHDNPAGAYAVVALVWRPGQMSPVHAHKTWCALAVHQGVLSETTYEPGEPPLPTATRLLGPGDASHGMADPRLIHRIANLSCRTAISIHCYGTGFEQFAQGVNHIHAA